MTLIFVTGGTGLLGNCIVRALCKSGHDVRVLCRAGTSREPFDDLPVSIVEGDLSDPEHLVRATEGCDTVIHSAAFIHIGWQKLEQSRQVNVEGTRHIAHACLRSGAKLIHISTVDTLPAALDRDHPIDETGKGGIAKTPCSYVVSKAEAEQVVRDLQATEDLPATIIHPGFMLGPFDWKPSSGRMLLEVHKAPIVAAPPGGCSFCDARDVAEAIVQSVKKGRDGQNYILAGENLTYQELWKEMLLVTGRKRKAWRLGPSIRLAGRVIDFANRLLPLSEGDVNGAAISMGCLKHFYDSRLAEEELSYRRRPIQETLHDAWQFLSERF